MWNCTSTVFLLCLFECDTKEPIKMKMSEDAFFQTNSFPFPYHGDPDKCNIVFNFDGPAEIVKIEVLKTELLYDKENNIIKNNTSFEVFDSPTYSFKDHYTKKDNTTSYSSLAIFGYIAFEFKDIPRCIMETEEPFFIASELEIFFIQSDSVSTTFHQLDSCHWKFRTFKGYGFKVVIELFEPTMIAALEIRNSTDTYVNYRSAVILHPYYNTDNYLQIDLNKIKGAGEKALRAYVTIIKKTKKITNKCKSYTNLFGDKIWNITTTPYNINVYCSYDLIISNNNTEYDVIITPFLLEVGVDILKYTYDAVNGHNTTVLVDGIQDHDIKNTSFTLFGYSNGTQRHYFWEYELDGSLPSYGTSVIFKKINCRCIAKSIPCTADEDHRPTGIMNRLNYRYCGNLRCNFTIKPCLKQNSTHLSDTTFLQLSISREYYDRTMKIDGNADIFTVYSDGMIVFHIEIDTFNIYENEYVVFLNSSKNNIFEVITYPSRLSKILALRTTSVAVSPVIKKVYLTADAPYAIVDTGLFLSNTIKVQSVDKNQQIISNTGHKMSIFENENLLVSYDSNKCFGSFNPHVCNIPKNEFAMYIPQVYLPSPFLIIKTSQYYQKGCVFNQNIFITSEHFELPIAIVANSKDNCITALLINFDVYDPSYFYIASYWTTSKKENVKVFAGSDVLYFEFNYKTSHKFTHIYLFSFFYSIMVPKNSAIYFQIKQQHVNAYKSDTIYSPTNNPLNPTIPILKDNYRILVSTAYYGTSKGIWGIQRVRYCPPFRNIKYTTFYFQMSKDEDFTFTFRNETTHVKQNGETFIFENPVVNSTEFFNCVHSVYTPGADDSDAKNGIVFLIEIIDDSNNNNNFLT